MDEFSARPRYIRIVDIKSIRSAIRSAAPELRASGLAALYVFGSQARGDAREDSDIDLAFDVDPACEKFSLLDQAAVMLLLEKRLGRKVDFLERSALHRDLRPRIEREMIRLL